MQHWWRSAVREEAIVDRVRIRRVSDTECEVVFLAAENPIGGINITNTLSFFMKTTGAGFVFSEAVGPVNYSLLPDRTTTVVFILVFWRGGHVVTDGSFDNRQMYLSASLYCHTMELYNRLKWLEIVEVPILGFDRTDTLAPWSIILDIERITVIAE